MKDHIIEKARQAAIKAKVTLSSGSQNSLNDVIKTEEQATVFMTMIKSL